MIILGGVLMLKNYINPAIDITNITISDVGEEIETYVHSKPARQRFRYIIHFVMEGEGTFKRSNSTLTTENKLTPNTVFGIYQNDTVCYNPLPNTTMHYYWVTFTGKESDALMQYIGFTEAQPTFICQNPALLTNAFQILLDVWNEQDRYAFVAAFFNLISTLRKCNKLKSDLNVYKTDNEIFAQAELFIKRNLRENIHVQDVAAALNIDRCHFSRIFKKRFDISPHDYINNLRLSEAENLLLLGNYSIAQIVEILNFPDIYSFNKRFKKCFECSPLQYRNKHLSNKKPKS